MLLIDALKQPGRSFVDDNTVATPTPARPRIHLQTGAVVGQCIQWPIHTSVPLMLTATCAMARSSGALVSIPAPGHPATLLAAIRDAVATTTLPPDCLELTFSAAMLGDAGAEMLLALSALRDESVALALENFGPDDIALASRLPFSCVILAPSCVALLNGAPAAVAPLCALIDMVQAHQMHVIASGIETEAQRALLSALGCDFGEGTLFGPAAIHVTNQTPSPYSGSPSHVLAPERWPLNLGN